MKKRTFLTIILLVTIALVCILYLFPKKNKDVVRIGILPQIIPTLPHWVAVEKGYYTNEGIDIREVSNSKSPELVKFMMNSDVDYMPGVSTTDVLNATVETVPLHPIIISHSKINSKKPFDGLLVPRGSKITTVKDLEGKKIAVYPGNTASAAIKVFLKEQGVDISKCEFIAVPPSEHLKVLQLGKVDCTFTYEPTRSDCMKDENTREIFGSVYASFNEPCAIGLTVLSQKFLSERPDVAMKIIKIWDKSIDFINKNPIEARHILQQNLNLDEKVAQNATWVEATLSNEIDKVILNNTINTYKKIGVIDSLFQLKDEFFLKK